MKAVPFDSVDAYIASFPQDLQGALMAVRQVIGSHAPEAEETIAYGMPAYRLNRRPLVYFAGYKKHIGFYATPTGHEAFAADLARYKQGKGSVQFPLTEPLPLDLIGRIVRWRVQENTAKGGK